LEATPLTSGTKNNIMKTLKHLFSKLRILRRSRSSTGRPVLVGLFACLFALGLLLPAAVRAAFRWSLDTGNSAGPPATTDHPIAWSSSPVLDLYGTVYVGSANGYLYCLNPADGTQLWRVRLNASGLPVGGEPIEATPAMGENGWIYVATRTAQDSSFTSPLRH